MKTAKAIRQGVVVLCALLTAGGVATDLLAQQPSCGDVLLDDVTLKADLECQGTGLVVGADGITVNLNGFSLVSTDGLGVGIEITKGFDGVTIKGGVIDGFREAVRVEGASDLTLKEIMVPNLSRAGIQFNQLGLIGAFHILHSESVTIKGCSVILENIQDAPDAIILESVEGAQVESVAIEGGTAGVHVTSCGPGETCDVPLEDQLPTSGEVMRCAISGTTFGVLISNGRDVVVRDNTISQTTKEGIRVGFCCTEPSEISILSNEVSECQWGIQALSLLSPPAYPQHEISNLLVRDNEIHDNLKGIALVNVQDSMISGNHAANNLVYGVLLGSTSAGNTVSHNNVTGNGGFGIGLMVNLNDPPWPGPSGNVISHNYVRGNGVDLVQAATSGPNTWRNNCYQTSDGQDIAAPDCQGRFRRGDANANGGIDLGDPITILGLLFEAGETRCAKTTDSNDSGIVDVADSVYLFNYLFFEGGNEPPVPFRTCGFDRTEDLLECVDYRPCN